MQVKYNLDYHCELMLLSLDQLNEAKTKKRRDSVKVRKSILGGMYVYMQYCTYISSYSVTVNLVRSCGPASRGAEGCNRRVGRRE